MWKWRGRGNPKKQDFTPPLGKASQKTCSAFPHFHKPGDIYFPIQRRRKLASHLTEVIHFGNDFISSVASLRSLDAFHWNRWRLSIGITGGIRRNTQLHYFHRCSDCYRVERTSSRAGLSPAVDQRLFTAHDLSTSTRVLLRCRLLRVFPLSLMSGPELESAKST